MKYAVTTASGNLGSAIVKQLISDVGATNVIGIARTPAKATQLGVEVRKGDYTSKEEFDLALQDVDVVLIVSGNDAPEKRVDQHRNIIEAAKLNGVKKIVYTSIIGNKDKTTFSPVISSNRQTEQDIQNSGLEFCIGRNGLYIEPDLEYLDQYVKAGEIANCAGEGKCAYTSRTELGFAYSKIMQEEKHNGKTYNLVGEGVTQQQLAQYINEVYSTSLVFRNMSVEEYLKERKKELGEFLGTIIGGIYEGIYNGDFNPPSDFEIAAGRPHLSALQMIRDFKSKG